MKNEKIKHEGGEQQDRMLTQTDNCWALAESEYI